MSPRSASLRSTAVVTPPAVSVKMPVVSASSWMPSTISSSVTASIDPPVLRARSSAKTPSAGLPIASDFAIVCGRTGRQTSLAGLERLRDRRAALGLGAVEGGQLALEDAELEPLLEAAGDPREERAGRDGHDHAVGQLEAELLRDLEAERLGALRVVGAQVDVHERPRDARRRAPCRAG